MASKKRTYCVCCQIGITIYRDTQNLIDNWKLCKEHLEEAKKFVTEEKEKEMAKPPQKEFIQEDILVDEFVNGVISDIEYEDKHEFKGEFARTAPAVRLTFTLDGYEQTKRTPWLSFSYAENARLYKVFIKNLVPDAKPFMDYDLDQLKGKRCKFLFTKTEKDGKTFYNVETAKLVPTGKVPPKNAPTAIVEDDTPF